METLNKMNRLDALITVSKPGICINDIAGMVAIRNHMSTLLNGTRNTVKRSDISKLSEVMAKLDVLIMEASFELWCVPAKTAPIVEDQELKARITEAKANLPKKPKNPTKKIEPISSNE